MIDVVRLEAEELLRRAQGARDPAEAARLEARAAGLRAAARALAGEQPAEVAELRRRVDAIEAEPADDVGVGPRRSALPDLTIPRGGGGGAFPFQIYRDPADPTKFRVRYGEAFWFWHRAFQYPPDWEHPGYRVCGAWRDSEAFSIPESGSCSVVLTVDRGDQRLLLGEQISFEITAEAGHGLPFVCAWHQHRRLIGRVGVVGDRMAIEQRIMGDQYFREDPAPGTLALAQVGAENVPPGWIVRDPAGDVGYLRVGSGSASQAVEDGEGFLPTVGQLVLIEKL